MGRTTKNESAICPLCDANFESLKDNRYWALKRHMSSCKLKNPEKFEKYSNCNVNNNCVIINVNINGKIAPEDIMKLINETVKAALEKILQTNDGSIAVKIFDATHCNPNQPATHIAVIPNINKNQMIILNDDGVAEVKSKVEGARQILDSLFENELPEISKSMDDKALTTAIKLEQMNKDTIIPDLITHMESIPGTERTKTSRRLKERVHI